jgi:predicted nucleic acid-binding protein
MDAYLAAFARGHAISLATLDEDFTRFKALSVRYLLAATTG